MCFVVYELTLKDTIIYEHFARIKTTICPTYMWMYGQQVNVNLKGMYFFSAAQCTANGCVLCIKGEISRGFEGNVYILK